MALRSLRRAPHIPQEELPHVRLVTDRQVAIRPVQQFVRLVYHRLPDDLTSENEGAASLHEEIRRAVGACVDILGTYPGAIYLSDVRHAQMVRSGFTAYFVPSGQGFRAIPLKCGRLPDGIIVCTSS